VKQIIEYLNSFLTIGLVLAGIGGVSYNVFREGGWLATLLGAFVDAQLGNPIVAIPVTIGVVIIGKMWRDHRLAKGETSRLPDVLVYIIMAAGVYFIWRYISTGSF